MQWPLSTSRCPSCASIPAGLADIFKLTLRGNEHYKSDNPADIADNPNHAHSKDSNFLATSSASSFDARPFFILFSKKIDQSKDIGLMMERDLEITKVAAEDNSPIPGVKFKVFGPFNENEATSGGTLCTFELVNGVYVYKFDGSGSTTDLVTDANGKIKITGLNWWKEYVIKETEPAEGFDPDMAITAYADETANTQTGVLNGDQSAFVLKIPHKENTTKLDKVKVTNKRSVKVTLNVEKLLTSYSTQQFIFKFDLKLTPKDLSNTLKELNAETLAKDRIETLTLTIPARTTNATNEQRVYGSFD